MDDRPTATGMRLRRSEPGALTVELVGNWRLKDTPPSPDEVRARLAAEGAPQRVRLDATALGAWDTALLVFVHKLRALCEEHGVALDMDALPGGVRRLSALARASLEQGGTPPPAKTHSLLARIGLRTLRAADDVGAALRFLGTAALSFARMLRGKAHFRIVDLGWFMQDCGPAVLPILTVISLLVGMVLAFLGAVQLRLFGAQIFVADLVAIGMAREMGALMTGIIMAGRTGASFAAQLGTMQVNEEIDALVTSGFDPVDFLVLPRMLALMIMMPMLCVYANLLGLLGGALVGVGMLDLKPLQYLMQTREALALADVAAGLIKGAVFAVVVAVTGCMHGMRCGRSAAAVGEATTAAVVSGILWIVVWDSVLTVVYTLTDF